MELQLDWQKQKGGVRRALFLASRQATLTQTLLIQNGAREDCSEMKIYLRVRLQGRSGWAWGEWPWKTGASPAGREIGRFQAQAWDAGELRRGTLMSELGARLPGPLKP